MPMQDFGKEWQSIMLCISIITYPTANPDNCQFFKPNRVAPSQTLGYSGLGLACLCLRVDSTQFCEALQPKPYYKGTNIKSTVFEDNFGDLGMTTSPKITSRKNKHIAIKYHFFLESVESGNQEIEVVKIYRQPKRLTS
jgi:hypothetical protein